MATFIKRGKKGIWYFKYQDASGNQKMIRGFTDRSMTVGLARKLEDEANAIRRGHVDPADARKQKERARPAKDLIDAFEQHLEARGVSDNHRSYTTADVKRFFDCVGLSRAAEATRADIDKWVVSLSGDAPRTVNRRLKSLGSFYRFCIEQGAINSSPVKGYPLRQTDGTAKRVYRHLEADEVSKLLKKTPDESRKFLYRFALATGLRFNEIATLKPGDFDFKAKTLTIRGNNAKAKRDQTLPIPNAIVPKLKAMAADVQPDECVFDVPARENAAPLLRADCEAAGVDSKGVVFHSLRHSFCMALARAGVHPGVLQKLARHQSLEITLRYYTHFSRTDERAAINALPAVKA